MHVACVSYFYENHLKSPEELLRAYPTLTGWAEGLAAAGARVSVIQRFGRNAQIERGRIRYHFVADRVIHAGGPLDRATCINNTVAEIDPSVIHVNGLLSAWQAYWLKRRLPNTRILVQDHANTPPRRGLRAAILKTAMLQLDAVSFAAPEHAEPWQRGGFLRPETHIFCMMEGSSRFRLLSRSASRSEIGLHGDPLCLWVGRLNANKDPITVLNGFEGAAPFLPDPRLAMVFGEADMLPMVQAWTADHPDIADRILLLGKLPHGQLESIYNSADLFLLGSHHEGSGYAVLEALACGVTPIITGIPSFRALLGKGDVGALWPVGDSASLAVAILAAYAQITPQMRYRVRAYFEANWSFEAIGKAALSVYCQLMESVDRTGRHKMAGKIS